MKKLDKKAFTLIELIVVVAVVGILVLLGMPRFIGHKDRAELARIQHDVKVMEQEIGTVLINNDDDFNKWEDNSKDFNQLIEEGKLFEKEGIAEKVEPIDEPYKIIPENFSKKINTKLKGTFYANNDGKVYYEHEKPLFGIPTEPENPAEPEKEPGYSDKEIQDLRDKGYIPIATANELNNVRNATLETYGKGTKWEGQYIGGLDKKYIQVANLDLSEHSEREEGWNPIGTSSASFTGAYDGGNYVITGLEVKGASNDSQGLFGRAQGAAIHNVGLIDNKVTGNSWVGGLVGYARSSIIENSYATGSVKGTTRVGGIVGLANYSTKISNSYATGSVEGTGENIGGLVGMGSENTIENSYATGSVTGSGENIGGLVGKTSNTSNAKNSITIINSYATGSVTGTRRVGGLVGDAYSGLTGSGTNISNSYATGEVKGSGTYSRVGGLVGSAYGNISISNSYAEGKVTGADNYVGGLVGFADTSGTKIINSYATGSVKGTDLVGGLLGFAQYKTTISNSYATGLVEGEESVGGLVGQAWESPIENSYATGKVEGTGGMVGGLVGWSGYNTISNSYATGPVTASENAGGLVGYAYYDNTISNSYATGSVTASENAGGLVGFSDKSGNTVTRSYWDTNTTGQLSSAIGGEGKTTVEMKQSAIYEGWNFDNVWMIDEGVSYPTLR